MIATAPISTKRLINAFRHFFLMDGHLVEQSTGHFLAYPCNRLHVTIQSSVHAELTHGQYRYP